MYQVELLVRLKVPDVVALTAANALRGRMGYGEVLAQLRRADYYLFQVQADSAEAAVAVVQDLAEHTNLFVNPNKHAFEVRLRAPAHQVPSGDGAYEVNCLVRSLEGAAEAALLEALRKLGYGQVVTAVTAGTLWTMRLRASDAAAALRLAEEIAITRSRDQGLLANPHYQTCEFW
jgi:phosphoribosylformylglycinamidine (FGAM) synthase PurS component